MELAGVALPDTTPGGSPKRAACLAAEAEAQGALLIEKLKLTIKKLRHEQFGQSSERRALLEQLELKLAKVEETAAQARAFADHVAAYPAAMK
ncbi:dephospho-CoA kinase [Bradyrhizobium japonicum]|jgi:dephospho-CoA kinase|nr:dephospho-CoA kinase [Bradyrhizobium elkanii]NLS72201.1 hypothetical protein [Bradyrhizobium brasilense]QOZ15491.1 hypothetical protein XI02_11095 [Bradyrhizobium sp. CCBAU 21365]BBC02442.1 transposase [Bradyrhizobium elkanii USDA 61]GEC58273.1 hypothetical protein BEL01nite_73160 [Bradyrhizobium elkanii]